MFPLALPHLSGSHERLPRRSALRVRKLIKCVLCLLRTLVVCWLALYPSEFHFREKSLAGVHKKETHRKLCAKPMEHQKSGREIGKRGKWVQSCFFLELFLESRHLIKNHKQLLCKEICAIKKIIIVRDPWFHFRVERWLKYMKGWLAPAHILSRNFTQLSEAFWVGRKSRKAQLGKVYQR